MVICNSFELRGASTGLHHELSLQSPRGRHLYVADLMKMVSLSKVPRLSPHRLIENELFKNLLTCGLIVYANNITLEIPSFLK